jgi:uncharacterized protein involved in tellurium resistance
MKPPQNVDLVLLVDASESMRPCFTQLREHLKELLYPLEQANFRIRFGLVAYAAAPGPAGAVYDHTFIGGSGPEMVAKLYGPSVDAANFFTTDPGKVSTVLARLDAQGNEHTLLALDIAADFPFGPPESTRRVIAVFTDEPLENGVEEEKPIAKIPDLLQKLMTRRILLFMSAPFSSALEQLGSFDGAEINAVSGGDGLKSVDFKKLLAQMGKSISIASMQAGSEPMWKKAIFGQDRWKSERSVTEANRRVVLSVGETARLSTATPITNIKVKLEWTAPVDLDLHAFFRAKNGSVNGHVYFMNKLEVGICLDHDAGIGDRGGRNQENITLTSIDGFQEILFATKIFRKGGSYADYDGRVSVKTNNGDEVVVPLTSRECSDWCVIAKITNDVNGPTVANVNRVTNHEPDVDGF